MGPDDSHTECALERYRDYVQYQRVQLFWVEHDETRQLCGAESHGYVQDSYDLDYQSAAWVGITPFPHLPRPSTRVLPVDVSVIICDGEHRLKFDHDLFLMADKLDTARLCSTTSSSLLRSCALISMLSAEPRIGPFLLLRLWMKPPLYLLTLVRVGSMLSLKNSFRNHIHVEIRWCSRSP